MPKFKQITSRDNPLVKHIARLLSSSSYRAEQGLFVAEGLRLVTDCADNNVEINALVFTEEFYLKHKETADNIALKAGEVILATASVFSKISDTKNPQGILAIGKIPENDLNAVKLTGKYVALENTADPVNLGAVARTAEALGISGIIMSDTGCDPYSPKALRAAMGTLLRLPVIIFKDFCKELQSSGLKIYPCVVSGGKDITKVQFEEGSAVLIGNEANGLTEAAANLGTPITIKMAGTAESLNAAAAAAIAMWELVK